MTNKLYYESLYQKSFDACVLSQKTRNGKYHIVLDQTAFYPGGGGQPCDLGKLNGIVVEDVYEQGNEIVHVIDKSFPDGTVHGEIDWERRFELMQQHLGQHILSAVFLQNYGLNTIGLRMDRDLLYIDLDGYVKAEQATLAETAANEVIYENISVDILYPDIEEIKRNSKREIPQTEEAIRIVKIGELDYTPCCGLQNSSTCEVGIIKIQRIDKHQSGSRIYFLCGRPALRWIGSICANAMQAMTELNCGETELAERVLKLQNDVKKLKEHKKSVLGRLAASEASELLAKASNVGGIAVVKHIMKDTTQDEMKQIYGILTEQKGVVALLGGETASGAFLMFGCNKGEKRIDVREAFKKAIAMIDGKGGGGASYAQGFGKNTAQLSEAIDAAAEFIVNTL